jgi:ectoine hydroxylase-related dioxygenase (phytanoyl-CoA dioxygenase family)
MSSEPKLRTQSLRESKAYLGNAATLRGEAGAQGYLFFPGLVEAEARALRNRVLESCQRLGWVRKPKAKMEWIAQPHVRLGAYDDRWVAFQQEVLPLPEFVALGRHPAILDVLARVFNEPPRTDRGSTCRIMSPHATEFTTPPHQDHYYVRGSTQLWTVWMSLVDCPAQQGGLAVLPGSHMWGLLPHAGEGPGRQGVTVSDHNAWATADYACGDVLMFHCLTLHRALDNRTADRLRVSVDYRYQPSSHPAAEDLVSTYPLRADRELMHGYFFPL